MLSLVMNTFHLLIHIYYLSIILSTFTGTKYSLCTNFSIATQTFQFQCLPGVRCVGICVCSYTNCACGCHPQSFPSDGCIWQSCFLSYHMMFRIHVIAYRNPP